MLTSLRDGCRSLGLNWGLIVLVLVTNLAFALVLAVPLAFQLERELENRGASRKAGGSATSPPLTGRRSRGLPARRSRVQSDCIA